MSDIIINEWILLIDGENKGDKGGWGWVGRVYGVIEWL